MRLPYRVICAVQDMGLNDVKQSWSDWQPGFLMSFV